MKNRKIAEKVGKELALFLENLKIKNALLIHDEDCDGISSASILAKLLRKKDIEIEFLAGHAGEDIKISRKFDFYFILDIPDLKLKTKNYAILDHHLPTKVNVPYFNPRCIDKEAYIPVSCFVYEAYKEIVKKRDACWLAGIGILGDFAIKSCKYVLKEIKKEFPELISGFSRELLFEKSLLGTLTKIINSSRIVAGKRGASMAASFLSKINDWKEVFKFKKKESKLLLKWYFKYIEEMEKILKVFEKEKLENEKFVFFLAESKYNLRSTLASYLTKFYKGKVILIGQTIGKFIHFSARCEGCRINLVKFIEKLKKSVNAEGGGHRQAAGFRIREDKLNDLLSILKF